MALSFYMDVHIPRVITTGLRLRNINVLTSQEDKTTLLDDYSLLKRASSLERIFITFDEDFLAIANDMQKIGESFNGIVYCHLLKVTIGECIKSLELISQIYSPDEMMNRVEFLPV